MTFLHGLALAEVFYTEAVKPILDRTWSGLRYAAALLGGGSDVLGYDTPQSTDHHWGPRLQLFLAQEDFHDRAPAIRAALSESLPTEVRGFPTNFGPPDEHGVRLLQSVARGPIQHMVEITTVRDFVDGVLGIDSYSTIGKHVWLVLPQQRLLEVTAGTVFHDDLGLDAIRSRFAWYPHDVWLYLMAAQWKRIAQEEAFVGRAGDVGDEIGSAVIAARLVRDLMRLTFLLERRYAPYSKWLGTAFARLAAAPALAPHLRAALASTAWTDREAALASAYGLVAALHNDLRITAPLSTTASRYYGRAYRVIHAERFAHALKDQIRDAELRALPDIGGIDQVIDTTDVLSNPHLFHALSVLYRP
jgi:hypothetical protein